MALTFSAAIVDKAGFAKSDNHLTIRVQQVLDGFEVVPQFQAPRWMTAVPGCRGKPIRIAQGRLVDIEHGAVPENNDERRFVRNRAVLQHVITDLEHAARSQSVYSASGLSLIHI